MKKSLVLLSVLFLSVAAMAQVRTGTIYGTVTDAQGSPLPGVAVTLTSSYGAPFTMVTDDLGKYRFPALVPSSSYVLTAELQGFKKQERTGIVVVLGQQSKIDLVMEQGTLEEQVTVVAVTPTVDAKKTAVSKNVTQEILQGLPTSRDPWNVMQMAPSIIMDRENVGGSESGQQASYVAKGDSSAGGNNVWSVDGVVVTDPAAIGASPIYWDFDSFEEMNVITGGADVTVQTGGIALNMVTRRGGNKVSFGGRFYLTDGQFQAKYSAEKLAEKGVSGYNKINQIKDFGFNVGGPVIKDKAWLWGSYGVQDINSLAITGAPVKPIITDYNFKLNLQVIPSNRFEALYIAGAKQFIGRSISQSFPEGYDQDSPYHFGDPVLKLQDEQMIGNDLLISGKFAWMDASFQLIPHSDPDQTKLMQYDATNDITYDNRYYITGRPMYDYNLAVQYYNDKLFGVSHEIKLGVEYSTRRVTTDSTAPGNITREYNLNWADVDPAGEGNPQFTPDMEHWYIYSQYNLDYSVKQMTAFLQDTITAGRFNIMLGARYDHQVPIVNEAISATVTDHPNWTTYFASDTAAALKSFMPGTVQPYTKPDYRWNVFSPRLGITYDLFGTGKTILKLSGSMYGDFMGTGSSSYLFTGYGVYWAYMGWYWLDGFEGWDGNTPIIGARDGRQQMGEMMVPDPSTYGYTPLFVDGAVNPAIADPYGAFNGSNWWGFTPYSSTPGATNFTVDSNATSSRTYEALFTIDHELLADFSVGLNATYRKYNHFSWDPAYYTDGAYGDYRIDGQSVILDYNAYEVAGTIPTTIELPDETTISTGEAGGKSYYLRSPGYGYTPYQRHMLNTNYETFWGVDLVFNKRLSNKWMMDGSISYMDQKYHYGNGYQNPTNLWALDGKVYAPNVGGASGKINQYIFSHWMLKLEGLYQLPMDFNVSFTFNARAGHLIPHYINSFVNRQWTNPYGRSTSVYLDTFGTEKLPNFYQLNFRVEKLIKLGDTGKIYLMADIFNVFNSSIINRRYDRREGDYYINADSSTTFSAYANNYRVNELLNPRIMRLGIRFQF
ncbi:MAG TPA: carboxypeptidase regulatory-like domain-containing protein [Candidatus Aminicenantes bacterium]|nr:carboxypeptidase regulatory-like domain-containing protein [Candidatus Aminicenantes bacterium]HRY64563.1 carboxypeptidase regulatory-like domain-containing protein [Candidatus Aminicenantes bacterium]HRZ71476.1 carboxypeptidase regulatory-like domain-containing protein [Candidatus Aminicenantes bacterium]